jgi:restriction system protein
MVTQQSNDGGIDGIIKEDQLGFSHIYIQAKQWSPEQTVTKPEIQKFVGALQGQQAQKGLFITTAKFSSGALQFAENLLGAKVVLVDGSALTRLMIKHNVGVSVEHVYEVKRLYR